MSPGEVVAVVFCGRVVVDDAGGTEVVGTTLDVGSRVVVVPGALSFAAPVGAGDVWKFAKRTRPPAVAARTGTVRCTPVHYRAVSAPCEIRARRAARPIPPRERCP